MRSDVVIVGAGPSGLYLSLLLARQGFDVTVLEEHPRVGSPVHCTGILAADSFDEFNLPRESILNILERVRFYSPSGDSFQYVHHRAESVVIDRQIFDQALAAQALQANVRIFTDQKVINVDNRGGAFTVRTTSGVYEGNAGALACGGNYQFQRKLGLGSPATHLQTAQIEFAGDSLNDVELHFGRAVAPKGFGWAVPFTRAGRPYVRIGVMTDRKADAYFRTFVEANAARWNIPAESADRPRRKILPLGPIDKTVAERLVVIGDAAGIVKPTTGGGIYYSIVSAALAATVLAKALQQNSLSEAGLHLYQDLWRERFGSEVATQARFRSIAEGLDDLQIDDLFGLARTNGLLPLVRRTARFNYHKELIVELLKHPQARSILFRQFLRG